MDNETKRVKSRGSLFFPFLLIALGLIFLLNNIGLLSGDIWTLIIRMWPLILVGIGLDSIWRNEGVVGPVLMIGLGVVFLLSNFGYLALDVWDLVLRLWPILLIAIGLDVAIGHRSVVLSALGLIFILALLAGAVWLYGISPQARAGAALTGEEISQPLEGAEQARIVIEPGVAALRIDALTSSDRLIEGTVSTGGSMDVTSGFDFEGDIAVYRLQTEGSQPFFSSNPSRWRWDLMLNPDVPLDLEVNLGVGDADLDLSTLELNSLQMDLGVGQTTLVLPASGQYEAQVDGGIGELVVYLPRDLGARIRVDTGIAARNLPPGFEQVGDEYVSPGFAEAENSVDLSVHQGIGLLEVRYLSE